MFYGGLLYSSDLAVQGNFECRFSGTFTFNSRFTVKKLSRGCENPLTLLAVFCDLRVFVAVIQTSRAVFVFVNSPLDVETFCPLVTEWMQHHSFFRNLPPL